MNHIKEQIERESERYARNEWGDAYKGILPDDIIQKGEDAYANSFAKGANFALGMDRWVKVSERMPDNRQTVLATDGSTQIVLEYKHGCWFVGLDQIHFVTHWQPLPSLPQ